MYQLKINDKEIYRQVFGQGIKFCFSFLSGPYFSFVHKERYIDYVNCVAVKEQRLNYANWSVLVREKLVRHNYIVTLPNT